MCFSRIILKSYKMKSVVSFIALGLLMLTACGQQEAKVESRLRSVKYLTIKAGTHGSSRTFSGLAKASTEANLSFKVAGTILSLPVKVGDHLQKGQIIATLDASQYELQAQQAQASLAEAMAGLRNSRAAFERVKGLYENNNASRHDLDSARASADSSQAQVNAARKALQLARLNINYTQLKANKLCGVAEVNVSSNENVTSGQSIVKVTCGDSLDVEVAVPGNYIAAIKQAIPVKVTFSVLPGKILPAKVTEVGVAAISGGTTFPVTVTLIENLDELRSGLAAEVTFSFPKSLETTAVTVPPVAVSEDSQGRFVYLVKPGESKNIGVIQRKTVSVGELTTDGLEIIDGLTTGDKVVTAGVTVIRDGLRVRLN